MSWAQVVIKSLKTLPWKKIVSVVGPLVYDPVQKKITELIGRIGHRTPSGTKSELKLGAMEVRIKEIEQIQGEQTAVLSQIEDQIKSLDEIIQASTARSMIFGIVSVVSLITSVVVVILVLLK